MSEIIRTAEGLPRRHKLRTQYDDFEFGKEAWRLGREGFREFPMAIPLVDGKPCFDEKVRKAPYDTSVTPKVALPIVLVKSEEELEALMAGAGVMESRDGAASVETPEAIREALLKKAASLHIPIDKRWGDDRIRELIAQSENPVV